MRGSIAGCRTAFQGRGGGAGFKPFRVRQCQPQLVGGRRSSNGVRAKANYSNVSGDIPLFRSNAVEAWGIRARAAVLSTGLLNLRAALRKWDAKHRATFGNYYVFPFQVERNPTITCPLASAVEQAIHLIGLLSTLAMRRCVCAHLFCCPRHLISVPAFILFWKGSSNDGRRRDPRPRSASAKGGTGQVCHSTHAERRSTCIS